MSVRSKCSYDSGRMSSKANKKVYEEMLLKELPGSTKSNQAMHAVLESSLQVDEESKGDIQEAQRVRNHALIHYLASLANSNNNEDKFDFDFVDSLILNGADINSRDKSGQTIFHEVARSWNLDVASFLIEHGADLNRQDTFGRSPLHVASAVDYADMVEFLVKNGADINIKTCGEGQMPIHYAAKNDACKSLKMLLGYGAGIDSRDAKNRTPLQVAAEMNRSKSAKLLVQHGAPAGVYDGMGNSALSLLIEKLPDVAVEALDQFHSVSTINRKEYFFLNYLEGNRLNDPTSPAYSALEIAVQNQEFDVILHPVMRRLILIKWQKFGRFGALIDLILNLVYAILWTILAVTTPPYGVDFYIPWDENIWRLIMAILVCLMTLDEIRKQLTGILKTRYRQKRWLAWRVAGLREELAYCHPRWPQEEMYLKSEIEAIEDTPLISTGDAWVYFDWFSLSLILATIASHLTYVILNTELDRTIYLRIITVLLLVLWLRMLKYARPFEGAGPFVVIFGHIAGDIVNWGLLLSVVAIPFACAFWITFGTISSSPVKTYSSVSSLIYNMFSMMVVNDHDFENLENADASMARLLCGSFIGIMAIICLNLLIALLSDTFSRVYGNAVANAIMQRAKTILLVEKSLRPKTRKAYAEFIKNCGSPEAVDLQRDISINSDRDEQKSSELVKDYVKEIHVLLNDRLGKQYGEGQLSDFDIIRENIEKLQNLSERGRNRMRRFKRNLNHLEDILISIGNAHNLSIEKNIFPSSSSSGGDDSDHSEPDASRRRRARHSDSLEDDEAKISLQLKEQSQIDSSTPSIGRTNMAFQGESRDDHNPSGGYPKAKPLDSSYRVQIHERHRDKDNMCEATRTPITHPPSERSLARRGSKLEETERSTKTSTESKQSIRRDPDIRARTRRESRESQRNVRGYWHSHSDTESDNVSSGRDYQERRKTSDESSRSRSREREHVSREKERASRGSTPRRSSIQLDNNRPTERRYEDSPRSSSDEHDYEVDDRARRLDRERRGDAARGQNRGRRYSKQYGDGNKDELDSPLRVRRSSKSQNHVSDGEMYSSDLRKSKEKLRDQDDDPKSSSRRRERPSKERRYYQDWENRSVKSVTF